MLCWGNTVNGELGLGGIEEEKILIPRELVISNNDGDVKLVACGSNHTVFLLSTGQLLSCGSNDFGQLGQSKSTKKATIIDALSGYVITHVSCGSFHTMALTDWGDVYVWGSNVYGQLGNASLNNEEYDATPRLVKSLATKKVVQIACGSYHSFVLLENGKLLSWGRNNYGQLGLGSYVKFRHEASVIEALEGVPIRQIASGGNHCFVVSIFGAVFTWGRNTFGQLGLNDEEDRSTPIPLEALRSQRVRYIACGENHTAILTQDGGVFTFGAGSYGQLGHGVFANEILPRKILELMGSPVIQIACGRCHTLVYESNRRRVYAFGQSGSGQIGNGSTKNSSSPISVKGSWLTSSEIESRASLVPDNRTVVKRLFCGGDQSFVTVSNPQDAIEPDDFRRVLPMEGKIQHLRIDVAQDCAEIQENSLTSQEILQYLETVFGSSSCISASFVTNGDIDQPCGQRNPRLNFNECKTFFHYISKIKKKALIELMVDSMKKELIPSLPLKPLDTEAMRVYLIIMQCHLFDEPDDHISLCDRIGKAILRLEPEHLKVLASWWTCLTAEDFLRLVTIYKRLILFIVNTFKNDAMSEVKQSSLTSSLITSAKVLRILNYLNNSRSIVSYEMFYIPEITELVNVRAEYTTWLHQPQHDEERTFYMCDYPFLFDAVAKTIILQTDAVVQMERAMAEVTQINLTSLFFPIDPANPYLVLQVSRDRLVEDTVNQLLHLHPSEFKKPMQVTFKGESAFDGGGVRKEFFMLLSKELTDLKYGMFKEYEEVGTIWFNEKSFESVQMFEVIGVICGLACYNGNIINLPFPLALYKKLLDEKIELDDLKDLSPSLCRSLKYMLEYENADFADAFSDQYLEIGVETFGHFENYELKPGGKDILLTKENREEYVKLYVDFLFNKSIEKQYQAFHVGFYKVLGQRVIALFHAQELKAMVVGNENYDWNELELYAEYRGGYTKNDKTIKILWEVFHEMDHEQKKKFLLFSTGYDRITIFGMKNIKLTIQPTADTSQLPVAHTCVNLLDLPRYQSKNVLRQKVLLAIEHTEGFGLV